jgi:hypothetical protein
LVGIAGKEDLDAPDLAGLPMESGNAGKPLHAGKVNGIGSAETFRFFTNRKPWFANV